MPHSNELPPLSSSPSSSPGASPRGASGARMSNTASSGSSSGSGSSNRPEPRRNRALLKRSLCVFAFLCGFAMTIATVGMRDLNKISNKITEMDDIMSFSSPSSSSLTTTTTTSTTTLEEEEGQLQRSFMFAKSSNTRTLTVTPSFDTKLPFSSSTKPRNMIWPHPKSVSYGNDTLCLNKHDWAFVIGESSSSSCGTNDNKDLETCADLRASFTRYTNIIFDHNIPPDHGSGCLSTATVTVTNPDIALDFGIDESYKLTVTPTAIDIHAKTVYGAMHGLESLSQLVRFDYVTKQFFIINAPWAIEDEPRFQHRELLIDSSRHFLPLPTIKRLITALPVVKINTLHWHLTDTQSFPLCLETLPEFCSGTAGGAGYSYQEHYTREDLMEVVTYARRHGVRIMPEIDLPGHTTSWCKAFPSICTESGTTDHGADFKTGKTLKPSTNQTFDVIHKVLTEIASIFPDSFLHLGGDEVYEQLWLDDPDTVSWMQEQKYNVKDVYYHFVQYAHTLAFQLDKIPLGWEEVFMNFGTKLDVRSIQFVWLRVDQITPDIVRNGYRALYSHAGVWYLDNLKSTWESKHALDPCDKIPENQCHLILGGGGEMWGEKVDTSDLESTVFPKLGAIAERLWSPRELRIEDVGRENVDRMGPRSARQRVWNGRGVGGSRGNVYNEASARFAELRCLLNRRGIAATPLNVLSREAPSEPDSCFRQ